MSRHRVGSVKGKIYKNNGMFLGFTINIHQLQGFPLHGSLIQFDTSTMKYKHLWWWHPMSKTSSNKKGQAWTLNSGPYILNGIFVPNMWTPTRRSIMKHQFFIVFPIDQKCGYHRQMRTGQCQQTASMRHGKQVKLSQVFGSRSYWIPMWDWTYWICLNFLRILELACQLLCYAPLWDIVRTIQIIYDWSTTFVIRAAKLDRLYTVYCSLINSL